MKAALVIAVVLITCLISRSVAGKSDVIDATAKNFDKEVLNSPLPVMVEFFAPWCGHCKAMAGDWEKAATSLKGIVPVVKVDATVEQQLASKYGVKGYPTIKLFTPGSKTPTDYNGGRSAKEFVNFALNALPNNVVQLTPKSVDNFWSREPASAPRVLLFTSKSATPPLFKSLAMRFKDNLVFGEIRQNNKELCEQYSVDTFPTLLVLTGRDSEPQKFEGKIDPEAVTNFVKTFATATSSSKTGNTGEEKPESPKPKPVETRSSHTVTPGATSKFEILSGDVTTCGTLCIVAIVDTDESDPSKPNSIQMESLQTLVTKYGKDEKFAFRWLSRSSDNGKDALSKFKKEDSDVPLVAVLNTKRSKFAIASEFSEKALTSLLDRVIGGDVQYEKL